MFMMSQVEVGHGCPLSMTGAVLLALRHQPELAAQWEPLIASREYDPGLAPLSEKKGALLGMGMTERQGGSNVRANTRLHNLVGGPHASGRGASRLARCSPARIRREVD